MRAVNQGNHVAFNKAVVRNATNIIKKIIGPEPRLAVTFSPRCADSLSQKIGNSLSRSLALFRANIEQYRM